MLAGAETIPAIVESWLSRFERALSAPDDGELAALFHPGSHWRDLLALTWSICTVNGRADIVKQLRASAQRMLPSGFRTNPERTPPRSATRVGTQTIEAIFKFETTEGRGSGVLRLVPDVGGGDTLKAWTLHTALDELKGHEEAVGKARPQGTAYSRDFRGPNWLDLRNASAEYADRDPAVLVIGGGHAGVAAAARLKQLQVDTLIVDREKRIGDNWRNRYHALTLHNQVQVNHFPYMPFPPNWPTYIPKDKLANWFETYVESMELNYWTSTEFEGGRYDNKTASWTVTLRRADGNTRTMHPRHLVMATGQSGIPNIPDIPSLKNFRGQVIHAHRYTDGCDWQGKNVLIIGTGTSGHDIAQDLHAAGVARVTLVQRSPTMVVNVEPSAQLPYALYDEGMPLEDCDLVTTSMPLSLVRQNHIAITERAKKMDEALLDALARRGFRFDFGDDGTGWQFKYLTRGGGYYFNVGCSDLLVKGEVGLIQFSDIAEFVAEGARMKSGEVLPADLVVQATGYKGQDVLVRKLFGDAMAERLGPIWGFGKEEELRNMFARTPQPGLWFIAGSFAQCRIYSKYLALQILGSEIGLMPTARPPA